MFWYKEVYGDLFQYENICITTNGTIKKDGRAVIGAGCALEAKNRFTNIDALIGKHLKNNSNIPTLLRLKDTKDGKYKNIITFPVKHSWQFQAHMGLIRASMYHVNVLAKAFGLEEIYIPRPGCGNGQLNWHEVKPELLKLELPFGYDIKHYFITNEKENSWIKI